MDFARWCGADPPFHVLSLGTRAGRTGRAYLHDPSALQRARTITDQAMREYGIIAADTAMRHLSAAGIHLEAATSQDLRDLLAVAGDPDWWWPRRGAVTPLTTALYRIHALAIPVPLEQIPDAVARIPRRRRPIVTGEWPLAVAALRAWAATRPEWRLTDTTTIEPLDPQPVSHLHDRAIIAALRGRELTWKDLRHRLTDTGMTAPTAAAAILYSSLLHRTPQGYTLLGTPAPQADALAQSHRQETSV